MGKSFSLCMWSCEQAGQTAAGLCGGVLLGWLLVAGACCHFRRSKLLTTSLSGAVRISPVGWLVPVRAALALHLSPQWVQAVCPLWRPGHFPNAHMGTCLPLSSCSPALGAGIVYEGISVLLVLKFLWKKLMDKSKCTGTHRNTP